MTAWTIGSASISSRDSSLSGRCIRLSQEDQTCTQASDDALDTYRHPFQFRNMHAKTGPSTAANDMNVASSFNVLQESVPKGGPMFSVARFGPTGAQMHSCAHGKQRERTKTRLGDDASRTPHELKPSVRPFTKQRLRYSSLRDKTTHTLATSPPCGVIVTSWFRPDVFNDILATKPGPVMLPSNNPSSI